jgi:transcription-repair coupling factor (superfamily II helicase)
VVCASGLAGSSKALLSALLFLQSERPMLFLALNPQQAERMAVDLQFFLSRLTGKPMNVEHFPAYDVDPYRGLSPHPALQQQRASILWDLTHRSNPCVVASVRSFLSRVPLPADIAAEGRMLEVGGMVDLEDFLFQLEGAGYARQDPVTSAGEYARRGGLVDVFPPTSEYPLRIEFDGDEIASLRCYDPDTQRSITVLNSAAITPIREMPLDAGRLMRWADAAEEAWKKRSFFSRIQAALTQARQGEVFDGAEYLLPLVYPMEASLLDYLPNPLLVFDEPPRLWEEVEGYSKLLQERYEKTGGGDAPILDPAHYLWTQDLLETRLAEHQILQLSRLGDTEGDAGAEWRFTTQMVTDFRGQVYRLVEELTAGYRGGNTQVLVCSSLGRLERLRDLVLDNDLPIRLELEGVPEAAHYQERSKAAESVPGQTGLAPIVLTIGDLSVGFRLPERDWILFSPSEVFGEQDLIPHRGPRRRSARSAAFLSDFRDLKVGDYVVHVDHGIGQFRGLFPMPVGEQSREFVLLHYRDQAKLYVPVDRLDLLEKYSAIGGSEPTLDQLGGVSWNRTKNRIRKSMRDMAEELLKLYAQRSVAEGFRFSLDGPWQREFEDAFEYQETVDQESSILDVKKDMEGTRPMDRLLCGDVGYGKTEVAMRAAFKAVMDGKQVAILTPTTVLAFQHYQTFRNRFQSFPVNIEMLSRFRTAAEQKKILAQLESGELDILIGTHRILSKDIRFKDLGLLIVDEEQRFGVTHKEKLKQLKTHVDVLTMTATPIPRTLHMSMMGIRDISTIETPPKDRLSIQTMVLKFSGEVIRAALEQELARQGQVYFVHNRVESIYSMAALIQRLCPQVRVSVAHGQMSEKHLEEVMLRFVRHETDVLLATTIIENGLDIPLVNTIIINRSDRYGLSQLYQLRGRVGRSNRQAYAYLLVPSEKGLSDIARRRLAAIREFSDLGAGFRIAALDLELRGAGNLLGGEQHGHIDAVGFDLYCKMLEEAVQELKGETPVLATQTMIQLHLDIRIPEKYVPDANQRLRIYKRAASCSEEAELSTIREEMTDRYGPIPPQVENLFTYASLRLMASPLGVESIERAGFRLQLKFSERSPLDPQDFLVLFRKRKDLSISPGGVLTLKLPEDSDRPSMTLIHELLQQLAGPMAARSPDPGSQSGTNRKTWRN